ncbi:hypothetical protein [Neptuniibacter sp. QD57_21]|uniref:hypothetical protein n=1 Tax=Neptuniibacter sp. QD57_21 TaxID=3398213 RepID=UPI0039F52F26
MEFKILDRKNEGQSSCFLISSSLEDFITNIPSNYDSYEVQRSIVSNSYLDRLVHTVLKKGHIPSITLISEESTESIEGGDIGCFKILDGLQRTHRLKIIFETKKILLENITRISDEMSEFQIKRQFREELSRVGSSGNIFIAIKNFYDEHGETELNKCFSDNSQWFELWNNLSPDDEVKKMLILNAGHKPVNIKHQLELLFQNLLPIFESVKSGSVEIFREKDVSSASFSKNRKPGSYHFSHLISSLISFMEGKPVSTNTNFISKVQDDDNKMKEISGFLSYSFLEVFIESVYKLDFAAKESFGEVGVQWIGREVSLVSTFSAIGAVSDNESDLINIVDRLVQNFSKLRLEDYERCRNNVDLAKVNIGNVNKKNIHEGFFRFIENDMIESIDWDDIFSGVSE